MHTTTQRAAPQTASSAPELHYQALLQCGTPPDVASAQVARTYHNSTEADALPFEDLVLPLKVAAATICLSAALAGLVYEVIKFLS